MSHAEKLSKPETPKFLPPDKVIAKLGMAPPKLIQDWGDEITRCTKLEEFHMTMRGDVLDEAAVELLVQMKLHKDYLYSQWVMDTLDESAERSKLKARGFFPNG